MVGTKIQSLKLKSSHFLLKFKLGRCNRWCSEFAGKPDE